MAQVILVTSFKGGVGIRKSCGLFGKALEKSAYLRLRPRIALS